MTHGAFGDDTFCRALVTAVGAGIELAAARGKLQFVPTSAFAALAGDDYEKLDVTMPAASSSNSIV